MCLNYRGVVVVVVVVVCGCCVCVCCVCCCCWWCCCCCCVLVVVLMLWLLLLLVMVCAVDAGLQVKRTFLEFSQEASDENGVAGPMGATIIIIKQY